MRINKTTIEAVSADVRDMLGEGFDSLTFWDTVDGETDALDMIDQLLRDRMQAMSLAAGIKNEEASLKARRTRMEQRKTRIDGLLRAILDAAGERKVERPLATISRRAGSIRTVIDDEAAVPTQLCKITVKPDATAIRKQIEAGVEVPGAHLERGDDSVTVRVA